MSISYRVNRADNLEVAAVDVKKCSDERKSCRRSPFRCNTNTAENARKTLDKSCRRGLHAGITPRVTGTQTLHKGSVDSRTVSAVAPNKGLNTKTDPEVVSQNVHLLVLLTQDEHWTSSQLQCAVELPKIRELYFEANKNKQIGVRGLLSSGKRVNLFQERLRRLRIF